MKTCVLFGGFLIVAGAACAAGLKEGIPADVDVTLHEPVIAELIFSNVAAPAVAASTGQSSEMGYDITVVRPSGEKVKAGLPYWATFPDTISAFQITQIQPGQSFKRPVLLNQWFPFDEVGRYHVSVTVRGVEGTADFRVNVAARDEARLRAVCESLIKDARQQSPRGTEAALTLSFVSDDLAIPYLAQLASTPNSFSAVEGLARVGDIQAVAALASLLHHDDDQIRRQASGYLGIMLIKSGNDQLRRAITSVLNDPLSGK
jgi:hypothetical protein